MRPLRLLALATVFACLLAPLPLCAQQPAANFRVFAIAEPGGIHKPFVDAAKVWLTQEAQQDHFTVDYIEDTKPIDAAFLARYRVFIELNYPPYHWTPTAAAAFTSAIENGSIGWIGFHHAGLLGEFDGFPMWQWFSNFMGGIRWTNYIATFASANVHIEDAQHPVMRGVPAVFPVRDEEWYTWDKSPRPNVHVLATVDESSYTPDSKIKMGGDHPVVWTNEHVKARNVYIFMGHHPDLFENTAFTTLFHNSILWTSGQ
ncbi:ThuA domain-containing protein [Silvibacterium dinghuense]|uniref:ThuA domain-containing protein n=1 Tax=Silvibacterium dinghuense TaxID=1560006 RepID=A0A4Q1SBX0_9BACT|nr:ThuA domain-containing protein [Silvibacterium dinghuense]RXS94517.1 ThuA domain-containing protein [Silvibacterium dinghuense]GGH15621.1 hypothetical protein GCM10011586_36830 [Silvibacterium dinghuense]